MRFLVSVFLLLILNCSAFAQQQQRTWTSANGQHTFEAVLLSFEDADVKLKGPDGKVKSLSISQLSVGDQAYLSKLKTQDKDKADSDSGSKGKITDQQKEALSEFGLRLGGGQLLFAEERELKTEVSASLKAKKTLLGHELELQQLRLAKLQAENKLVMHRQKDVQLNAGLAGATGVQDNNRFIALINANASQVDILVKNMQELDKQIRQGQSFVNKARDGFVKQLLTIRSRLDSFADKTKTLADDEKLSTLVNEIEETTGTEIQPLAESRSLSRVRSNLEKLESIVLSDTIQLTDDGSGTFEGTVSINGYEAIPMIVDSGASLLCLPARTALEIGVEVPEDAQTIQLKIADGSIIQGKLVILETVRMGKFEAENVECAVLGEEAVEASALLGMSYLGNFKFELDASRGEIKMMTIDPEAK